MGIGGDTIAAPTVLPLDPAPDPLAAFGAVRHLPCPLLLESAGPIGDFSRYSYLMAGPREILRSSARPGVLEELRALIADQTFAVVPGLPPFQGGLAGYLSYELGASLEQVPPAGSDAAPGPDVLMGLYDWVVAWDRVRGGCWLIDHRGTPAAMRELGRSLTAHVPRSASHDPRLESRVPPPPSTFTRRSYEHAVQRIRDYILAGDVFQVNLSQRFSLPSTRDCLDLYRRLRALSPAPFSACFDAGDHQVLSISPELFLALDDGRVETRPIKGTRPRKATPAADAELATALLASPKDRG